jgi:hypothetical protein
LSRGDRGSVNLEVRTEETGEAADLRRVQFAGSHDPRRLARWLQRQFPGADLVGEPELRLIPARDPAIAELKGVVGRSALLGAGGIRTFPGELDWVKALMPSGDRSGPLLIPVRPNLEWTVEVALERPPQTLPESIELRTDFGSLDLTYSERATGYRVEGKLTLIPGLVQPSQADALRDFLVAVERNLDAKLEVP